MSTPTPPHNGRLLGVDAMRTAVTLLMIAGHTSPFESPQTPLGADLNLATFINQFIRFIIPFFAVLAGYFWAAKLREPAQVWGPTLEHVKRLMVLFAGWSLVYLLPFNLFDALQHGALGPFKQLYWNLLRLVDDPVEILLEGTKVHLWFLMALTMALLICATLLAMGKPAWLLPVGLALYLAGVAGGAYRASPWGLDWSIQTRDGPFFVTLFVVVGYHLRRLSPTQAWFGIGLAMACLGGLMHFGELYLLNRWWNAPWLHEYVLGTSLFGTGVALMALSNHRLLQWRRLAAIGPLALGIYCSHYLFVDLLWPLDRRWVDSATWQVGYVVLVFVLAYSLASLMGRHPLTRRFVM